MTACDVVVVGGGPAGSVCAARLASAGHEVLVLERDHHPRFHLGESLLPASMGVLEALGVLGEVRDRFMVKRGARFVDGSGGRPPVRYAFADAFHCKWESAFQVPRDEFDALLFRRAGECGASLCEGWSADRVVFEEGRAVGVVARDPGGTSRAIAARFVVDASGREAVVARQSTGIERIAGLERTALYTQFRGGFRDEGERAGDIQIVLFGDGDEQGWFWLIPFADGRTSVGAVVSPSWIRARLPKAGAPALFDAALAEAPAVAAMIGDAERLFLPRATGDYSFRVPTLRGSGWLALGDAAGFIDPLFSTGAHLAMCGALRGADVLSAALRGEPEGESFVNWEREQRSGAALFVGAVQAFYSGELVPYIFGTPQHPFLRRAITSMLSGDVFDQTALWAREMRSRFPMRVAGGAA